MANANQSAVPAIKSVSVAGRVFYGEGKRGVALGLRMLNLWPALVDMASIKTDDADRVKFNNDVKAAFDSDRDNFTYMVRLDDGTYATADADTDGATRITTADFKGRDKKAWGEIKRTAPTRHKIESAYRERANKAVTGAWQSLGRCVTSALPAATATRTAKAFMVWSLDQAAKIGARITKAAEKAELSADEAAALRPALAEFKAALQKIETARKATAEKAAD